MPKHYAQISVAMMVLLLALPATAAAMDNSELVYAIWMWAIIGSIFGFALVHLNRFMGLIAQVVFIFLVYAPVREWHDLHVGPMVGHEASVTCAVHTCGAMAMLLVAYTASWIVLYAKNKKEATRDQP